MLQSLSLLSRGERISRSLKSAPIASPWREPQNDFASARFEGRTLIFDSRHPHTHTFVCVCVCARSGQGKGATICVIERGYKSSPAAITRRFYRDIIARAYY